MYELNFDFLVITGSSDFSNSTYHHFLSSLFWKSGSAIDRNSDLWLWGARSCQLPLATAEFECKHPWHLGEVHLGNNVPTQFSYAFLNWLDAVKLEFWKKMMGKHSGNIRISNCVAVAFLTAHPRGNCTLAMLGNVWKPNYTSITYEN